MLVGLAAAVFGTPFAAGMAAPAVGALAKGGAKGVKAASSMLMSKRGKGVALMGAGFAGMQMAGSGMVQDYYTSIHGPGAGTTRTLDQISRVGNIAGATAMALGGYRAVTGRGANIGGAGVKTLKYTGAAAGTVAVGGAYLGAKLTSRLARSPFGSALAVGAMGGALAGAYAGSSMRFRGRDVNITGINSSPTGGISPELQFSTNNLVFALHNQRRRS